MWRLTALALLAAGCTGASGAQYYGDDDDGPIGNGADGGGGSCASVAMTVTAVTPAVQLMVDGSGSMFQDGEFTAVKNALLGATGVVPQYQTKAAFGASVYTSEQCPKLYASPCTVSNAAGVTTAINNGQNANHNYNPTVEALTSVVTALHAATGQHKTIILATDGVPNQCDSNNGDRTDEAVAQATAAYGQGISIYMLGIGLDGDTAGTNFLQKMANAGLGSTTNVTYWNADDDAGVLSGYQQILDKVLDCELALDGTIDPAQASTGTVKSNGTALTYNTDWVAVDAHTIKLLGAACTTYKTGTTAPEITAAFTCGASKP